VTTRVYVAGTLRRLRAVLADGRVGPAPFHAHAVTAEVREALPDAGEEDWEYAAATAAAQSSVALLADDEPARRVVLAIDVPEVRDAHDPEDPTVVEVLADAPLRRLAAVLADDGDAEAVVAAARDAVSRQAPDADRALERCLGLELGWWAAQEADVLLEEADPR
jgi:hypothetical protein